MQYFRNYNYIIQIPIGIPTFFIERWGHVVFVVDEEFELEFLLMPILHVEKEGLLYGVPLAGKFLGPGRVAECTIDLNRILLIYAKADIFRYECYFSGQPFCAGAVFYVYCVEDCILQITTRIYRLIHTLIKILLRALRSHLQMNNIWVAL